MAAVGAAGRANTGEVGQVIVSNLVERAASLRLPWRVVGATAACVARVHGPGPGSSEYRFTTPHSPLPTPYSLLPTPYSILPTPYAGQEPD